MIVIVILVLIFLGWCLLAVASWVFDAVRDASGRVTGAGVGALGVHAYIEIEYPPYGYNAADGPVTMRAGLERASAHATGVYDNFSFRASPTQAELAAAQHAADYLRRAQYVLAGHPRSQAAIAELAAAHQAIRVSDCPATRQRLRGATYAVQCRKNAKLALPLIYNARALVQESPGAQRELESALGRSVTIGGTGQQLLQIATAPHS